MPNPQNPLFAGNLQGIPRNQLYAQYQASQGFPQQNLGVGSPQGNLAANIQPNATANNQAASTFSGGVNAQGQQFPGYGGGQLPNVQPNATNNNQGGTQTQPGPFNNFLNNTSLGQYGLQPYQLGLGNTPAQQGYIQALSDPNSPLALSRLTNLQNSLLQAKVPTAEQTSLQDTILKTQNQIAGINQQSVLGQNPGLTSNQLNSLTATQQAPIENVLNDLLIKKSILGEQQYRNVLGAQVGVESQQNAMNAAQTLTGLLSQGQRLPEGIAGGVLSNALGLNLSPQLLEYRQGLQQGIIPPGANQAEAQFLLHPDQRFQLQQQIDPTTKLPYQVTLDKLDDLLKSEGRSWKDLGMSNSGGANIPTGGTNRFGAPTNIAGSANRGGSPQSQRSPLEQEQRLLTEKKLPLDEREKAAADAGVQALAVIPDLKDLADRVNTGIGLTAGQKFLRTVPFLGNMVNNSDFNTFLTKIQDLRNRYINSFAGTRGDASPQLQAKFEEALPSGGKVTKANIDGLNAMQDIFKSSLKSLGINSDDYPTLLKPTGQYKTSQTSGNGQNLNFPVTAPNGKVYYFSSQKNADNFKNSFPKQ